MKRFSSFTLAEVDVGIYCDEFRMDVVAFEGGQSYPLAIICDPASNRHDGLTVGVAFGDQNWGTHYGILNTIHATKDTLKIAFSGQEGPVPWLATNVTFDWTRIVEGKDLIFAALRLLCSRDNIPYNEPSA